MHHKSKWILVSLLFAVFSAAGLAQVTTTPIADVIHHADGTPASGSVIISWPAFTTAYGAAIPAGTTTTQIATDGALALALAPNSGANPIGSYYTAIYHLDDGSITRQYWVVPQSSTAVSIASIESSVLPTSVAIQVASKSYVDTAIAAAQAGHPLDSSPLVLKAGDTMTGPLVLPEDPVASMQASTKHYVDASVAAITANSGTLTGQTPQRVPLANSSNTANSSAAIGDDGQKVTVYEPLQAPAVNVSSSPANCKGVGVIFTAHGCINIAVYDDGSTPEPTPRNLTGTLYSYYAWGPASTGTAEARSTEVRGDYGVLATAGIRNIDQSTTSAYGIGDVLFYNWVHNCHAGVAYESDQGCQIIYNWGGQGNAGGHYNSTVPAGQGGAGARTLQLPNGQGCNDPLNQFCVPAPGVQMLDGGAVASGRFTAVSTASSHVPWVSEIATDQTTLPTAAAWGYNASVSLNPTGTWDQQQPQTFTLTTGAGAFAAGDLVCAMGDKFEEQGIISAVSGTAPAQTITLPLAKPETKIAIFKGGCKFIQLSADVKLGDYAVYPAVSIDGSHWIYGTPGYSIFGNPLPATGVIPETFDGSANAAFNAYCGARITKLDGVFDPFVTELEPNGCAWNAGDAISSPDFSLQKVNGFVNNAQQYAPSTSVASVEGIINSIDGMGASGNAVGLENDNFFSQNCSAYAIGTCGGNLTPPTGYVSNGHWGTDFQFSYMPASTVLNFQNAHLGQTSFSLLTGPWGSIQNEQTDPTTGDANTFFYKEASLRAQGNLWGAGGGVSASWTVGGGPGGHLTVKTTAAAGNTVAGFYGGASGGGDNEYFGGFTLGKYDGTTATDETFVKNWNEAGGFGAHNGIAIGVLDPANPGNHYPGFYESSLANGHTVSIANGTNICPADVCVGSAVTADSGSIKVAPPSPGATAFVFVQGNGGHNWGFVSDGSGGVAPGNSGFYDATEAMQPFAFRTDGSTQTAYAMMPLKGVMGWSTEPQYPDHSTAPDTGLSRSAAGVVAIGNGSTGDASGTLTAAALNAQVYQGPAVAPSGACSTVGWAFSQDGHISFCNGTSWTQKM